MHDQKVLKVSPDGHSEVIVQLADDQPSGLGWLLNGDLLIVAMRSKRLLRFDGMKSACTPINELPVHLQRHGRRQNRRALGNFGFDIHNESAEENAEIILVVRWRNRQVSDEVLFPNGTVITPDDKTLIVAETKPVNKRLR